MMERDEGTRTPPADLGHYWDAISSGAMLDETWISAENAAAIRGLYDLPDVPAPDGALIARMWENTTRLVNPTLPRISGPWSLNGHHRTTRRGSNESPGLPLGRANRLGEVVRTLAIGVLAGIMVGAVTIGLGARIAMRIAAMTSDDYRARMLTSAGERVGEITLEGTLILVIMGAFAGIIGGVLYVAVRPWLPAAGWRRGLLFGLLLFALTGSAILEGGNNPDYRRFGYAGLNICLFSLLPVLFGVMVEPVATNLEGRLPRSIPSRSRWLPSLAVIALASLGALAALPIIGSEAYGALVLLGLPLARLALAKWIGQFRSPTDLLGRPRVAIAAYVALLLPSLIGLVLALQAIGKILLLG